MATNRLSEILAIAEREYAGNNGVLQRVTARRMILEAQHALADLALLEAELTDEPSPTSD